MQNNLKKPISEEQISNLFLSWLPFIVFQEQSKNFVTRENLDAKIEECLNSLTDYNYAIDLEGNVYTGFEAEMKMVEKAKSPEEQNVAQSN